VLYNLVYCSTATAGVDAAAVDDIIAYARRHNPAHGITGLLVFGSGVFFQWLEGPRDNVRQLFANLAKDRRHESIVLLSENEEIRERLFPEWSMELVEAPQIRDVLEDALDTADDEANAEALRRMLEQLDDGALRTLGNKNP
jgi:uncharacterized Fe-S cluster-containing MiaB family protein